MIFNKYVKTKEAFIDIQKKITRQLGHYKHPKELTESDIKWLKENIEQFDKEVLDKVIKNSELPNKPVNKKVDG
jgi:hypothetical protein